jgi:hypothetical protein
MLVLGFAVPSAAQADADPASDYLYTTNVFLPLTTKVSPQLARELRVATAAAAKAGNPIRVALIATSTDLGRFRRSSGSRPTTRGSSMRSCSSSTRDGCWW